VSRYMLDSYVSAHALRVAARWPADLSAGSNIDALIDHESELANGRRVVEGVD